MTTSSRVRTVAVAALLVALIVALHGAAALDLRGPTQLSADGLSTWFEDPVTASATILRWIALVLSYYLLVVVLAVGFGSERAVERRSRFLPGGSAGPLGVLLGITAVTVPFVAQVGSVPVPPDAPATPAITESEEADEGPAVATPHHPLHPLDGLEPERSASPAADTAQTITVEHGDHLWSIAESELADAWGRDDLSDAEIVPYWQTLIAQNADKLVEPGNADLILPGQILDLPEVPDDPQA